MLSFSMMKIKREMIKQPLKSFSIRLSPSLSSLGSSVPFCVSRFFTTRSFSLPQLSSESEKSRSLLSESSSSFSLSLLQKPSLRKKHVMLAFPPSRQGVHTPEHSHLSYLPTSSFSTLSSYQFLSTPPLSQTSLSSSSSSSLALLSSSSSSPCFFSSVLAPPSLLSSGFLQTPCLSRNSEKESFLFSLSSLCSPSRGYRPAINWMKTRFSARMHQYRKRSLKKKTHSKVILRFKLTR